MQNFLRLLMSVGHAGATLAKRRPVIRPPELPKNAAGVREVPDAAKPS